MGQPKVSVILGTSLLHGLGCITKLGPQFGKGETHFYCHNDVSFYPKKFWGFHEQIHVFSLVFAGADPHSLYEKG